MGQTSFCPRATNRVCYIVTGKGICIIIAMRNLTLEFHDKTISVEVVVFMGSEIDLVANILAIIRPETRCRPCCVGK